MAVGKYLQTVERLQCHISYSHERTNPVCGDVLSIGPEITEHFKRNHPEDMYRCSRCDSLFMTTQGVGRQNCRINDEVRTGKGVSDEVDDMTIRRLGLRRDRKQKVGKNGEGQIGQNFPHKFSQLFASMGFASSCPDLVDKETSPMCFEVWQESSSQY